MNMTEHEGEEEFLLGPGMNRAPAGSRVGAAWIRVAKSLAAEGGQTASESGDPNPGPYERVTTAAGLDVDDALGYVVAICENVIEVEDLPPDVFPVITGAVWGALLTGVEVARDD
jgi:hypothetical protein